MSMYGLTGTLVATSGSRAALAEIMRRVPDDGEGMKGCILYVIAEDTTDEDTLHIFEVWESKEAHDASLTSESVRAVIGTAMPLLDMERATQTTLRPLFGIGLPE